ncbi:hypothetical protein BJ741DRAFT_714810 [Chytriomyces cf. hyalinus JEL632]|nr:hypothetical protein BJ741DRAFT_714810 [Chytriomyces cf. hyalinus JEL632]
MPSMRSVPTEVFPIFGMISVALGFGVFVAHRQITRDQTLRIHRNAYNPDLWMERIERPAERQTPFTNYFYRHVADQRV